MWGWNSSWCDCAFMMKLFLERDAVVQFSMLWLPRDLIHPDNIVAVVEDSEADISRPKRKRPKLSAWLNTVWQEISKKICFCYLDALLAQVLESVTMYTVFSYISIHVWLCVSTVCTHICACHLLFMGAQGEDNHNRKEIRLMITT